ncbi:MAG: hypothetical protein IKG21_01625, partial [Atopobiaceae bacterium]|nr:hypothetical protein [Atopobiaceae bacterium]
MKDSPRTWARRGLSLLLSLSMAMGGVPASAYAEALESSVASPSAEAEGTEDPRGEVSTESQETQPQPEAEEQQVPEDEQQPEAEEQQEEASQDGNPAQEQAPPAMPAFDGEAQVGDVTVRVHADEGAFPEGVRLEASYIDEGAAQAAVGAADELLGDERQVVGSVALDVRVVDAEGNEVEPANGMAVQVSFQTARVADEATVADVFHVLDDGAAVQLDASEDGDVVEASTLSFSTYLVTFSV